MAEEINFLEVMPCDVEKLKALYWDEIKKGPPGQLFPPLSQDEIDAGKFFFIKKGEKTIGATAVLSDKDVSMLHCDQPHLMRTFLKPEFRGKGLFSKVLEKRIEVVKALRDEHPEWGDYVYTIVDADNERIQKWYKKRGWEVVAQETDDISEFLKLKLFPRARKMFEEIGDTDEPEEYIVLRKKYD